MVSKWYKYLDKLQRYQLTLQEQPQSKNPKVMGELRSFISSILPYCYAWHLDETETSQKCLHIHQRHSFKQTLMRFPIVDQPKGVLYIRE